MEIHYIWLPEFKNIKQQGFNFSSRYFFDVKIINVPKLKISVEQNPTYIDNFFERENIVNVTAIVGQNGAGKSNILDYIKSSFPEGLHRLNRPAIIAVSYKKDDQEDKYIYVPETLQIISDELEGFKIITYDGLNIENVESHGKAFYENTYIYYSNIFDTKVEDVEFAGIRNISTTSLIRQERDNEAHEYIRTLPKQQNGDIDADRFTMRRDSYDIYLDNELRRNIQFLLSDQKKLIKFPLPEKLFLSLIETDLRFIQVDKESDINSAYKEFLISKLEREKRDPKQYFLSKIYLGAFLNFVVKDKNFTSPTSLLPPIGKFNDDVSLIEFVRHYFQNLPTQKYLDPNHGEVNISFFKSQAEATLKFFNLIEQMLRTDELKIEVTPQILSEAIYSIYYELPKTLPASDSDASSLLNLLSLYMEVKGFTDFLSFNWRSLSSGEQSMFSLLSRFHHLIKHDFGKKDLKPNLVILIDEGDIYYHPNWQKDFFEVMLDFLSKLYKSHQLQIILTTNTPFLSSDLPKNNIIFIEKRDDHSVSVQNANNSKEDTFAGNIHLLYADTFYMTGALMGSFAKKRVQAIIDYIAKKEKTSKHEDYRKTLNIIGEPVLKRKLLDMWLVAFRNQDELEILEARIKEIRSKNAR